MRPFVDLTGHKYGMWTVSGLKRKVGRDTYWFCHCACGQSKWVYRSSLSAGKSLSCGCRSATKLDLASDKAREPKKIRRRDLTGERFGKLLVIGFSHVEKNGDACWSCRCDCGVVVTVRGSSLRGSRSKPGTKSCKCIRRDKPRGKDLLGHRFGNLVVTSLSDVKDESRRLHWVCACDCGQTAIVCTVLLTTGSTTSCGCMHKLIKKKLKFGGVDLTPQQFASLVGIARSSMLVRIEKYGVHNLDELIKPASRAKASPLTFPTAVL